MKYLCCNSDRTDHQKRHGKAKYQKISCRAAAGVATMKHTLYELRFSIFTVFPYTARAMNALQIPFFSKCEDTFGVRVLYNVASGYSSSAGWPFSLLDGPFPVVFTSCTTLPNPASLTAHVSRCKGWYTPHRNQLSKYLAAPSLTSLGLIGRDRRHKKSTKSIEKALFSTSAAVSKMSGSAPPCLWS